MAAVRNMQPILDFTHLLQWHAKEHPPHERLIQQQHVRQAALRQAGQEAGSLLGFVSWWLQHVRAHLPPGHVALVNTD